MDARRKFFLFRQSEHFCAVPWNHVVIHTTGDVMTCNATRAVLGNINNESLTDILRSDGIADIRRTLLADEAHSNCAWCQSYEQPPQGYRYLRDMYNDRFRSSDVDYQDDRAFVLSGIDLHWSNTCNLRCVTCWAKQSSAIAAESGAHIQASSPQAVSAVIDFIVENQGTLREIYLSGGEPTLIKHNLTLLERIQPRNDLIVRVNSNFDFDRNNRILARILEFPTVQWTASADGMHEQFEYIRSGATWHKFLGNLEHVKNVNGTVRINSVFCVPTAQTLLHTHEFFRSRFDIHDFTINQCAMEQHAIFCRNLPMPIKHSVRADIAEAMAATQDPNMLGQLKNCQDELDTEPTGDDWVAWFQDIDRRRGTTWTEIFPELACTRC